MNTNIHTNINNRQASIDETLKTIPKQEQPHQNYSYPLYYQSNLLLTNKEPIMKQYTNKDLDNFTIFFSYKQSAQSLQKRNDNLYLINFQNCDQQPDEIYNRRKKKAKQLIEKQNQSLNELIQLKQQAYTKFQAISQFIEIFCDIKRSRPQLKIDYYSQKTFYSLKRANQEELRQATKVIRNIHYNCCYKKHTEYKLQTIRNRQTEFLILPRFLISKQKICKLIKDQQLQNNFQFLIYNECLGHYNNEANKKLPDEKKMVSIRQLLKKKDGKQKYRKICSINHGNKLQNKYSTLYFELYSKSLNYLKYLDGQLKKGKKMEDIKKKLINFPTETDDTIRNQCIENDSSSNSSFLSFGCFSECLQKLQKQDQNHLEQGDQLLQINSGSSMKKSSPPNFQNELKSINNKFSVRKSATMESTKQTNILIIRPKNYET